MSIRDLDSSVPNLSLFVLFLGISQFFLPVYRVWKRGSSGKGVFSEKSISIEILENVEILRLSMLENTQTVENN